MSNYLFSVISIVLLLLLGVINADAQSGTPLETIQMDDSVLNDSNGVFTNTVLENGVQYLIEASGSFNPWCPDTSDTRVNRDAKYEYFAINGNLRFPGGLNNNSWLGNLRIKGETIDWGDYNLQHAYEITYIGKGQKINFWLYDDVNGDNCGAYTIKLYATNLPDTDPPTTTASPLGVTYSSAQNVSLTCNDGTGSGCRTTRYCLGSGCTPSTTYSSAINISSSNTLRFYSTDNASNNESIKTEVYTISQTGQNVRVDLSHGIYLIFSQLANLCTSSSSILAGSPAPAPSGYTFIGNMYDVTTCAIYTETINVTIPYDESLAVGKENKLKLFHWENGSWKNVTVSVNTGNNTITGRVSSLSPFGIGYSTSSGSGSGSSGSKYSTGANENMMALIAILAISGGVILIRKNKWIQTK